MGRAAVLVRSCAAGLLLSACAAGATASPPTWVPQPSFSGEGGRPQASQAVPQPPTPSASGSSTPSPNTSGRPVDSAVVATRLTAPDAIAVLPDGSALVGERTTGRIVRVQPRPGQPVTVVRTLTGLDTSGGGGLLDLALSPSFTEDSLVFAYISTPTDNRVVDFTLKGAVTPVLTGITHGASDNKGRIAFDKQGNLYVATGAAGQPSSGLGGSSLAGKVLRTTLVGGPAPGNPNGATVYAHGLRESAGLCVVPSTGQLIAVQPAGPDHLVDIDLISAGADYGWPSAGTATAKPLITLSSAQGDPGGCAVIDSVLYVTTRTGKAVLAMLLTAHGSTFTVGKPAMSLTGTYGRLDTVIAAPDGALWLTTSNRDGHGRPIPDDERVLRIVPSGPSDTYPG